MEKLNQEGFKGSEVAWVFHQYASRVGTGCCRWVEPLHSCREHRSAFQAMSQTDLMALPILSSPYYLHHLVMCMEACTSLQKPTYRSNFQSSHKLSKSSSMSNELQGLLENSQQHYLVWCWVITTNPNNLCSSFFELLIRISESTSLVEYQFVSVSSNQRFNLYMGDANSNLTCISRTIWSYMELSLEALTL